MIRDEYRNWQVCGFVLVLLALANANSTGVRLAGTDHYVYLSNEADVLREMKSFFSTLR